MMGEHITVPLLLTVDQSYFFVSLTSYDISGAYIYALNSASAASWVL